MKTDSIFSKRAGSDGHFGMLKQLAAVLVKKVTGLSNILVFHGMKSKNDRDCGD